MIIETIIGEIIEAGANAEGVPVVVVKVTESQLAELTRNPLYRPADVVIRHGDE